MVIRFLFSIIFCCQLSILFAQKVVIRREGGQGYVYASTGNALDIIAENYSCKSLVVKASGGKITNNGDCHFTYDADSAGIVVFSIYVIKGQSENLIEEVSLEIRPIPVPAAAVGGYMSLSVIPVAAFKAQAGIGSHGANQYGLHIPYSVTRFNLTIVKDDSVYFHAACMGNVFCEQAKKGIRMLEPGDLVLISNIHAAGPGRKEMRLLPLEYRMK